jgi:hypothetical protein
MLISEILFAIISFGRFNISQNNKFQATNTKIQDDNPVWVIGYWNLGFPYIFTSCAEVTI